MDKKTAWQRFTQTGKVDDYLDYTRYSSVDSLGGDNQLLSMHEGEPAEYADYDPWGHHSGTDYGR